MHHPILWGLAILIAIGSLVLLRQFHKVKRQSGTDSNRTAEHAERVREAQREAMTTNSPTGKVPE
jgi:hypothetical protein